jgi:hypothetical protein
MGLDTGGHTSLEKTSPQYSIQQCKLALEWSTRLTINSRQHSNEPFKPLNQQTCEAQTLACCIAAPSIGAQLPGQHVAHRQPQYKRWCQLAAQVQRSTGARASSLGCPRLQVLAGVLVRRHVGEVRIARIRRGRGALGSQRVHRCARAGLGRGGGLPGRSPGVGARRL